VPLLINGAASLIADVILLAVPFASIVTLPVVVAGCGYWSSAYSRSCLRSPCIAVAA
jgi:hypothetical protein